MFDTKLLLKNNKLKNQHKIKLKDKKYYFTIQDDSLNLYTIKKFVDFTNSLTIKLPIIIELNHVEISDKLCFVLLECLCLYLIENRGMRISISIRTKKQISIDGIESSPLNILVSKPSVESHNIYVQKFKKDIYKRHYRKLVKCEDNNEGVLASKVSSEIATFLKVFDIHHNYISAVTNVLGELIDNALEHSESDCLIDIDVSPDYIKKGDSSSIYNGLNIAIMNLSNYLIGEKIWRFFDTIENNKAYERLHTAYNNHSKFWNDNYDKRDFFMLSAFQHGISGRSLTAHTGGTGLTQLITALEEQSDAYNCYVISGNRMLSFQQELLKQDDNGWVGFNVEHDFINKPPEKDTFSNIPIFFPGVAYNLNFVFKKETNHE